MQYRHRTIILAVLAVQLLGFAARAADDLPDPRKLGPYQVGVTTVELVDHKRDDKATSGPRTLQTEIWYPAGDEAKSQPKNKFSDAFFHGTIPELNKEILDFMKVSIDEVDKRYHGMSVRDARIRDGKYPLVIFSHGNGGIRTQSQFWCEHIASHGYIVVSPDHTGNCAVTVVDGKPIKFSAGGMVNTAGDRVKDVSFLIDTMTRMAKGGDSRFTGRVDLEHIGVAGHSFGGLTSAFSMDADNRIDAIIPMAPVWPKRTNFTTPVMIFLATEDATIGLKSNEITRKRYDESKGPHFMIELPDGGHFSFTEMFYINPKFGDGVGTGQRVTTPGVELTYLPMQDVFDITNTYSTAFLGVYLKGQDGYKAFLNDNHFDKKALYYADFAETKAVSSGK